MKITDVNELSNHFKVGDEAWACSYAPNGNNGKVNILPIKGVLMPCRHEKDYTNMCAGNNGYINYFIPLKKDGKTPSWQKAIRAYSLCYASTEDECIEMYNELINSDIEWHKKKISKLRKLLIKPKKS